MIKLLYSILYLGIATSCSGTSTSANGWSRSQQDSIAKIKTTIAQFEQSDSLDRLSVNEEQLEIWINKDLRDYILQRQDTFAFMAPLNLRFLNGGAYISYRFEDFNDLNKISFTKNQKLLREANLELNTLNDSTISAKLKGKQYLFIKYPTNNKFREFANLSSVINKTVFKIQELNTLVKRGQSDTLYMYSHSPSWTDETYVGTTKEVFKYRIYYSYPTPIRKDLMSEVKYYIEITRPTAEKQTFEIQKKENKVVLLDLSSNQIAYELFNM